MTRPARPSLATVAASAVLCLASVCTAPFAAEQYSVRQHDGIVQLEDSQARTVVSIVPSAGNVTFSMTVKGQEILRFPYASIAEFKARPGLAGIPFMGPWANRLDEQAFYANGKKYTFNMELGNVQRDGSLARRGCQSRREGGVGNEPARVLQAAGMDGTVPVRPHG